MKSVQQAVEPVRKVGRRVTPQAREAFRVELIDIARQLFLTEGYSAVTIRRVTSMAGVTPMAFYWYFDNKDSLLTVIWNDIIQESVDFCAKAASQHTSPVDQVTAYFEAFLNFWLLRKDYFKFIFLSEPSHVDFSALRSTLFGLDGVAQHRANYSRLVEPLFGDRADAHRCAEQVRVLSLYKAIGFLHCAIGIYRYTDDFAADRRDMVVGELRQCLSRWLVTL